MAETLDNEVAKTESQVMTMGKVQRFAMEIPNDTFATNAEAEPNVGEADAVNTNDTPVIENKEAVPAKELPAFTEDQLKAYFEAQGIKYEGLEKLKEKINYEPSSEPTVEQKEAAAKAKETRALNKFIEGGGTGDQFYAIKAVAEADPTQFAINTAKSDLVKAGYTLEEAETFLKEQYFQVDDAELEQDEDETDRAFKKRTKEYFAKQLANLSTPYKTQAATILADLNSAIESEDLQAQQEVALSAKIDEDFKALPRLLHIEVGEIGGKTVSPIDYDVSETDLAEVRDMLKNAETRNNFLFNTDGSLNTTNLTSVLIKAKMFDSAAQVSFLTGQDRATKAFHKIFPATSAQELGVGGSQSKPNDQTGKPASFGKPQRVQPQR